MNRKQKMQKQMAKRAKARENKKEKPNPSAVTKDKYISKAERAKLEAETASLLDNDIVEKDTIE